MNTAPSDLRQRLELEYVNRHRELERLVDRYAQLLVDVELIDLHLHQLDDQEGR